MPDTYLPQALTVYQKEYLSKLSLQHGAKDIINWIKQANHLVAIATESTTAMAKKKLKAVDINKLVDVLVTSNDTGSMKPDPAYLTLAMSEANVSKAHTIVVGDGKTQDIVPAEKLGLKTILIPSRKFNLNEIKPQIQAFLET
jgi:putative hydrolase of the HAD superfamily